MLPQVCQEWGSNGTGICGKNSDLITFSLISLPSVKFRIVTLNEEFLALNDSVSESWGLWKRLPCTMQGSYLLSALLICQSSNFSTFTPAGFMSVHRGIVTARKMAEVWASLAHLGRIVRQLHVWDILIPDVMVSQGEWIDCKSGFPSCREGCF